MKNFRLFSLMVSLLATAVTFSACSDDDEAIDNPPVAAPTVTLTKGDVTAESIAFTLTPANAVKAAWVYFEEGKREVTAEQVLTNGTSADADKVSELEAAPLNEETAYVIYAAVEGADGTKVLSEPLKATTLKGDAPERLEFVGMEASAASYPSEASGYNLWEVTMKDGDENSLCVNLCVSLDADRSYLPEGEFDTETTGVGALLLDAYTHVTFGGERSGIASGFMTAIPDLESEPGEVVYEMMGELTLTDGRVVDVFFEGPIEGCKAPAEPVEVVEIRLNQAKLKDLEKPAGEFFIGLNDSDWHYEGTLAFKTAETNTYLPSGTFSLAVGSILGDANSSISGYGYDAPGYARDWKSCVADVELEDGIYYLDVNIETNEGKKYHITFEGEIENMPVPTNFMIENPFIQVDLGLDEETGLYTGVINLSDGNYAEGEPFIVFLSMWVYSETEYLSGEYLFMTKEEAAAKGVKNYIENDVESSYYMFFKDGAPASDDLSFSNVELYADTAMPEKDVNMFSMQAIGLDGTIFQTFYQGALYGGAVSSEPVSYPIYNFASARVEANAGNFYNIYFFTNSGLLNLWFACETETFGPGRYVYDATGEELNTFSGAYIEIGMDGGDDKTYTIESGVIGVVKNEGGSWTFQLKDVIAKADDGTMINLGPVADDGSLLSTPSVAAIQNL